MKKREENMLGNWDWLKCQYKEFELRIWWGDSFPDKFHCIVCRYHLIDVLTNETEKKARMKDPCQYIFIATIGFIFSERNNLQDIHPKLKRGYFGVAGIFVIYCTAQRRDFRKEERKEGRHKSVGTGDVVRIPLKGHDMTQVML